jgi:hypothetical protein
MRFVLAIADNRLTVEVPDHYGDLFSLPVFDPFLTCDNDNADARLVIQTFPKPSTRPDPFSVKRVCPPPGQQYPILRYACACQQGNNDLTFVHPELLLIFRQVTNTMEIYRFETSNMIDRFHDHLMLLLACLLSANNGILLHGAGFAISGVAGVLIGPSGAGKSTAAGLMQHDFLLSDDVVSLTNVSKVPTLHSTPFGGRTDGLMSAPLRAIFFPEKSSDFSIRPISPRAALLRYLQEHGDYIKKLFKPHIRMAFENAHMMFRKIPSYEMSFSPDYIDREEIRRLLVKGA